MGTDVHCVLQKRDTDTGEWNTVMYDIFPGRDHLLFDYLQENFQQGFPDGFQTKSDGNLDNVHNGYWMGDHSFGYCNLEDFVTASDPFPKPELSDKYTIDHDKDSLTIHFQEGYDECAALRAHKESLQYMLGHSFTYEYNGKTIEEGVQLYRYVYGFDS